MKHLTRVAALLCSVLFWGVTGYSQSPPQRLPDDLQKIAGSADKLRKPEGLTVACYTFPNYHPSALGARLYGPGWTEYNLTRAARPWFPGHQQPRTPLLGELDESKPETWERYND